MESRPNSPNSPPHSFKRRGREKVKAKCKSAYIACKLQLNKSLSHPQGTGLNSEEETPLRKTLSEPNTPGAESKKNYFCHFKDIIVDKTRELRQKECISKMTCPNYEEVDAELLKLMRKPSISPFAEKRKSVLEGRRPVSGPPKFHGMEYEEDSLHDHSRQSPYLRRSQSARRPSSTLFQNYTPSVPSSSTHMQNYITGAPSPSTHMQIQNPSPQLQSSHSPRRSSLSSFQNYPPIQQRSQSERRSSPSLFQHNKPFQHSITSSQEQCYPTLIQNNMSFQHTPTSKERRSSASLLRNNTDFMDDQPDSRSSPSLFVNSTPLKDRSASTNRSIHLQRSHSEKRSEKPTSFQNYRPGQLYPSTERTDGNTPHHQQQLSRRSTPSLFYNFKPFPPSETPTENQMMKPLIPSKLPCNPINQMTNNYESENTKIEERYCPIDSPDSPNSIRRKGAVKSACKTSYEIEKYVVKTMKELKLEAENRNNPSPNWEKALKKSMMISQDGKEIKLERENRSNLNPRENWEKAFRKSLCNDAMLATVKIFDANSLLPPPPGVYCVAKYRYTSKHIDEISLERGDIISPSHQLEPGWWFGTMVLPIPTESRVGTNSIKGVFPANYVNCFIDLYKMN